jgi:choline kinase
VRAILLAARSAARLGSDGPTCLLRIAGKSLLERHLDSLARAAVRELTVVLGHGHELVQAELNAIGARWSAAGRIEELAIEHLFNDQYQRGSLVSLQRAAHQLVHGGLWMDAALL